MREIKIANTIKLAAALSAAQGRAKARTLSVPDLIRQVKRLDKKLGITRTNRQQLDGLRVTWSPDCEIFPSAYHWRPMGTAVELVCRPTGWRLADCWRENVNRSSRYCLRGWFIPPYCTSNLLVNLLNNI